MQFWIITGALAIAVAGFLVLALLRGRQAAAPAAAYDLEVYRGQLDEVDRDVARGVIGPEDAERVRAEVSRRILAADAALRAAETRAGSVPLGGYVVAGVVAAGLIAGSFALYGQLGAPGYGDLGLDRRIAQAERLRQDRPSQAVAEAGLADAAPNDASESPDYVALVQQLRQTVAGRPDDLQGHRLLAQSEARLGNFAAAHVAQARVVELLGDDATAADLGDWADMMVIAAGGYVSPEAEAVLDRLLTLEPGSGPGRYYYGLMLAQTGRPDVAFRLWDGLLRAGPSDAPWIPPIVEQIDDLAARAGVANYQRPEIGSAPGPSAEDIEAAGDMTPAERMEMIEGMVGRLSDRLATEGGPPEDWARLIGALGVLGRTDEAQAIYANALDVFAEAPGALDMVNRAAERAGLR